MKILFIHFLLLFPFMVMAQTKQKAEQAFVTELNHIIKNSKQQHWAYEGYKMTIDSPFVINKEGILSVTTSYTKDTEFITTKMWAPINKIDKVAYDLYLILEFKRDDVSSSYREGKGNEPFIENEKDFMFHIGAPLVEDMERQIKLQKLLDDLQKYYK